MMPGNLRDQSSQIYRAGEYFDRVEGEDIFSPAIWHCILPSYI